jgi:hypothetical protein
MIFHSSGDRQICARCVFTISQGTHFLGSYQICSEKKMVENYRMYNVGFLDASVPPAVIMLIYEIIQ